MSDSANTPIMSHDFRGAVIQQRAEDGYLNATAMCKAAGKLFGHYKALDTTQAFLGALASDIGITISQLVVSQRGNSKAFTQGTWVHPHVAIHLAQWLSPEFAVQVSKWVFEWMSGETPRPVRDDIADMNRASLRDAGAQERFLTWLSVEAELNPDAARIADAAEKLLGSEIPPGKPQALAQRAGAVIRAGAFPATPDTPEQMAWAQAVWAPERNAVLIGRPLSLESVRH